MSERSHGLRLLGIYCLLIYSINSIGHRSIETNKTNGFVRVSRLHPQNAKLVLKLTLKLSKHGHLHFQDLFQLL